MHINVFDPDLINECLRTIFEKIDKINASNLKKQKKKNKLHCEIRLSQNKSKNTKSPFRRTLINRNEMCTLIYVFKIFSMQNIIIEEESIYGAEIFRTQSHTHTHTHIKGLLYGK